MSSFEDAIKILLDHEGVLSDHPSDPGGFTKFGISSRSYPNINIKELTKAEAITIYKKDWWDKLNLDNFPYDIIAQKLFDISVNIGINPAVKCLQRAIRSTSGEKLKEDGIIGIKTIQAIKLCDKFALFCAFKSEVAGYYRSLVHSKDFLEGWLNRAYS